MQNNSASTMMMQKKHHLQEQTLHTSLVMKEELFNLVELLELANIDLTITIVVLTTKKLSPEKCYYKLSQTAVSSNGSPNAGER